MIASANDDAEMVSWLIENGAEVNTKIASKAVATDSLKRPQGEDEKLVAKGVASAPQKTTAVSPLMIAVYSETPTQ